MMASDLIHTLQELTRDGDMRVTILFGEHSDEDTIQEVTVLDGGWWWQYGDTALPKDQHGPRILIT